MSSPRCACGQPSPDAFLCRDCTAALGATLAEIPGLAEDLDIALANQAVLTERGDRHAATAPLPYSERASAALTELRGILWLWATALGMPTYGLVSHTDAYVVLPPITPMAQWLLDHMNAVRQHSEAGTIAAEVKAAADRGWQVVNKPPSRVYAGPCPTCGTDLLSKPGHTQVTCMGCGTTHDIATRQAHMRDQLDDHLGTATYASAILSGLSIHVSAGTIRVWASRHRLEVRTVVPAKYGGEDQPLYRLGDIVDLALARDARAGLRVLRLRPAATVAMIRPILGQRWEVTAL